MRLSQLFSALALTSVASALWPLPADFSHGTQALRLSSTFDIIAPTSLVPPDFIAAVERTKIRLRSDLFTPLQQDDHLLASVLQAPLLTGLSLSFRGEHDGEESAGREERSLEEELHVNDPDESYTLVIPPAPESPPEFLVADESLGMTPVVSNQSLTVRIIANTTLGLLRGLQTFEQLVYSADGTATSLFVAGVPWMIRDAPAFPHRGYMLDTSRNYYPVGDILRTLDTMASVKLNVFHWHAVDATSWPLEVPGFEELSAKGAYDPSRIYDQATVDQVMKHAHGLGIRVMLEIDVPGHTACVAESHPEYVACAYQDDWANYGVGPPTGQLRIADGKVQTFAEELVKSAAGLSKSKLVHTGGDEVNKDCYASDLETQRALKAKNQTIDEALSSFIVGVEGALKSAGKTMTVWEEMVLDHDYGLSKDTVVMPWISSASVKKVLDKGYRIIHAASDFFYLDCGGGFWLAPKVANSWCDPFKTWQKIYSFDPYANVSDSQRHLVLGGQTLLWSEQSDPSNLDPATWPRAAAAAEVFWTGGKRDAREALPRLNDWRFRAVKRGVKAIALQPEWCARRPGKCDA